MLTIQPNFSTNYKPAFKMNQDKTEFEFDPFADEDSYKTAKEELEEQRDEFENLANNKDLHLPKTAQKLVKGGAVVTGGILGGMATGWGAKKSIQGFKALNKSKAVVGMKAELNKTYEAAKKGVKSLWEKFTKTKAYTTPKEKLVELGDKFAKSKIGKPIVKAFNATKEFVEKVYDKVKTGVDWVLGKIKSVKKETYEKVAVNTVGASGGVASGVTALKEQSEKDAE